MDEQLKQKVLRGLDSCGFHDGMPNICGLTECPYREDVAACVHQLAHDAGMLISEMMKGKYCTDCGAKMDGGEDDGKMV